MMENLRSLENQAAMNPDDEEALDDIEPFAMTAVTAGFDVGGVALNVPSAAVGTLSTWKNQPSGRPKRPLSAYNIFFQHEREKIVSNSPDTPVTLESLKVDPNRRPKKRRHRKSHGKIGFADLARTIGEKWKSLDSESKSVFEACARKEKQRYQEEIKEWKDAKAIQALAEEEAKQNPVETSQMDMLYNPQSASHPGHIAGDHRQDILSLSHAGVLRHLAASGLDSNQMPEPLISMASAESHDYLQITQQVIDMARASLSLPLFAGVGSTARMNVNPPSHFDNLCSLNNALRMGANQPSNNLGNLGDLSATLRMNANQAPGNFEPIQLSNMPYGNMGLSNYDPGTQSYFNQMMQPQHLPYDLGTLRGYQGQSMPQALGNFDLTLPTTAQGLQNQAFATNFDTNPTEFSALDQNRRDRQTIQKLQSHHADGEDLVNMINASLKDNY